MDIQATRPELSDRELLTLSVNEIISHLIKAQKAGTDVNLNRLKCVVSSKYGLSSQPRLVDIIAAVPEDYKVYFLFFSRSFTKILLK